MTTPSNANTSGLAPCPFCGGEAWLNDYDAKYSDLPPMSRAPQCRSCGASLGYLTTPAKATEAWNRRVTAASAQARIAELSEQNAAFLDLHNDMSNRMVAAEARADRLADSNEGLTEDLYQAVLVAYRRGAHEWAWLNYPQWRNALAAGQEVAPIARAALQQETQK